MSQMLSQMEVEMGRIVVHPTPESLADEEGRTGFGGRLAWTPIFAGESRSLGMPQRVVTPLKQRRDTEERRLVRQPFGGFSVFHLCFQK